MRITHTHEEVLELTNKIKERIEELHREQDNPEVPLNEYDIIQRVLEEELAGDLIK